MEIMKKNNVRLENDVINMTTRKNPYSNSGLYPTTIRVAKSFYILTWHLRIANVLNVRGWNSLPGVEARGVLGTIPIGLHATLFLISHISVCSSMVLLVI